MASTDNCVKYDEVFFKHFGPWLGFNKSEMKTLEKCASMGIIQRERLVEIAISIAGNLTMDSRNGRDHSDGSDTKTVVSSFRNNKIAKGEWTNSFRVSNVKGKHGALRVVAFNKLQNCFHYFFIPQSAYEGLNVVEIVIERVSNVFVQPDFLGIPNRSYKWWEYEVESFEAMCAMVENKTETSNVSLAKSKKISYTD